MCEIDRLDSYFGNTIPSYLTLHKYIPDIEEEEEEKIIELSNDLFYEPSTSATYNSDGKKVNDDYLPFFRQQFE